MAERKPPKITGWLPHPAGDGVEQGPLSITPGRDFWRYVFTAAALSGGGPPGLPAHRADCLLAAAKAVCVADAALAELEKGEDAD